jgi:hypothetical protein
VTSQLLGRSLDSPDEVQDLAANCRASVAHLPGATVKRIEHESGWRWSVDNAPAAGTPLCGSSHVGYVLAGQLAVRLADGQEAVFRSGDAFVIPPGHDAWVVGDVPCVTLDMAVA